jgi:PilZ domain
MGSEHRKSRRRYVYHGARIVGIDGSAVGVCRILDLSASGARLQIKTTDTVPDHFILLLSRDGRVHRKCSVVWRNETAVGVEFIQQQITP